MKHFRLDGDVLLTALLAVWRPFPGRCDSKPKTAEQQDQEIRQKSAEATATIKEGAKQTAEETKKAADDAGRKLTAVAEGVKDGLQSGIGRMDLNSASEESLAALPGIGERKAHADCEVAALRIHPRAGGKGNPERIAVRTHFDENHGEVALGAKQRNKTICESFAAKCIFSTERYQLVVASLVELN